MFLFAPAGWTAAVNPCDLNGDGVVNIQDVQLATNMALGLIPCTANIDGSGVCNLVVIQRIISSALGATCVTSVSSNHYASLTWTASTSSNVAGYNVYRATTSGGPYTKLTSSLIGDTSYTDIAVQAGQTYYYVATAVDTSNNESTYSNQATAVIPSP